MNKNTSVILASAIAAVLALGVVAVAIPHQAFATNQCCDPGKDQKQNDVTKVAVGGNGGSGGAGGAGGEGGAGGANEVKVTPSKCCDSGSGSVNQKANGGDANGGRGGNANGGDART